MLQQRIQPVQWLAVLSADEFALASDFIANPLWLNPGEWDYPRQLLRI